MAAIGQHTHSCYEKSTVETRCNVEEETWQTKETFDNHSSLYGCCFIFWALKYAV